MGSLFAGITLIFSLAWCATALLRRASAARRHMVWTCAFAAALLLAPLRWRMPQHPILKVHEPVPAVPAITTTVAAGSSATGPHFDFFTLLPALWALGTLVTTGRLITSAARLRSIVRKARGKGPVLVSSGIRGPLVAGVFRPVILLPDASDRWTVPRRRAVFAHEAAHIRRNDPAILWGAHVVTALYWFHPLCWLAAARLRAESETACDDAALTTGLLPSDYAGHLLELAGKFDTQPAIPMASTSHLEPRMKSILNPLTNRSFQGRAAWLAAVALTAAILAPLTTFTLRAQPDTGGTAIITGIVTDPTGARVPRAKVKAINSDLGNEESATADPVGGYSFTSLPAGHYTIEAQAPGFATFRLNNLALVSGGKLQADARLAVGHISEAVTVSAQGVPGAQPKAATPLPNSRPIRVGGNLQAAAIIQQVKPVYPADLQAQGIEGAVLLQAIISKDGVPHSIKVATAGANPEFVTAAMDAVSQWRYTPVRLNGEPIEALTTIQVDFTLTR